MPACTRSAIALCTDVFVADDSAATARRTGVVPRPAKLTGQLVLALVPCGTWREGKTPLAHLAAQGTPWRQPVAVAPAAMQQRLHTPALAWLQDRLREGLATLHGLTPVGEEGLCAALCNVSIADSPGLELLAALHTTLPGAGGSAATAGATRQAVWDSTSRLVAQCALTPWNISAQR